METKRKLNLDVDTIVICLVAGWSMGLDLSAFQIFKLVCIAVLFRIGLHMIGLFIDFVRAGAGLFAWLEEPTIQEEGGVFDRIHQDYDKTQNSAGAISEALCFDVELMGGFSEKDKCCNYRIGWEGRPYLLVGELTKADFLVWAHVKGIRFSDIREIDFENCLIEKMQKEICAKMSVKNDGAE